MTEDAGRQLIVELQLEARKLTIGGKYQLKYQPRRVMLAAAQMLRELLDERDSAKMAAPEEPPYEPIINVFDVG